jgi:hypothetical protein
MMPGLKIFKNGVVVYEDGSGSGVDGNWVQHGQDEVVLGHAGITKTYPILPI